MARGLSRCDGRGGWETPATHYACDCERDDPRRGTHGSRRLVPGGQAMSEGSPWTHMLCVEHFTERRPDLTIPPQLNLAAIWTEPCCVCGDPAPLPYRGDP